MFRLSIYQSARSFQGLGGSSSRPFLLKYIKSNQTIFFMFNEIRAVELNFSYATFTYKVTVAVEETGLFTAFFVDKLIPPEAI